MGKVTCGVCGREIDSRGLSGHMKTHPDTQGVRSPKGSQHKKPVKKTVDEPMADYIPPKDSGIISYPENKPVKKPVKKPVTSKPASNPASNAGAPLEKEWEGLFR